MVKKIIYGCEERGDAESAYLTRYTLFDGKRGQLCLHVFHRSDGMELHDHPWDFVSLILWRGYIEETPCRYRTVNGACVLCDGSGKERRRAWPGMLLFRRAEHAHRVELVGGRRAVTLVWTGKRRRQWGFFTGWFWQESSEYFREKGCK